MNKHLLSNTNDEELDNNKEVAYLLKILPSTLKTPLIKFMYQDIIDMNPFFQNREDNFYERYLEEVQITRFDKGDVIAKAGN
jgi:hypothetical protein